MCKSIYALVATVGWLVAASPSRGQDTNTVLVAPATRLESFETNIGVVIIKGTTDIGTIAANAGTVAVRCREITDAITGHQEFGIALEITQRGPSKDRVLIDYEELGPLLKGVDLLSKMDASATPLNAFDATYTTKGGLRIVALGDRRTPSVQYAVRDVRVTMVPVSLSREDLTRFYNLVDQAKKQLDSLRQEQ